jgi:hypothetical protein
VKLADQWTAIGSDLPARWSQLRLALEVESPERVPRALALLTPLVPARACSTIRFSVARVDASPEALRRALRRLDGEAIAGRLAVVTTDEAPPEEAVVHATFAVEWDQAIAELPTDWSDVYAEIDLDSTDDLDRGALLLAPVNPVRFGATPGFRFRVAHSFGYGASPQMTRRCLERLDEEKITGAVRIVYALSDTHPVGTQGPVWQLEGRTV